MVVEIPESDAAYDIGPARCRVPACDRRLAARHDKARVVSESWCEYLADPAVEQAKNLVRVEYEHHALAPKARQALGGVFSAGRRSSDGGSETLQETAFGRLDRTAVDLHDRFATASRLPGKRLDECRLADAGDAVDEDNERAALLQRLEEGVLLHGPA